MKLQKYLDSTGLSQRKFARIIGVTATTVCRLSNGQQQPTMATMRAIMSATDGAVTADDFWVQNEMPL